MGPSKKEKEMNAEEVARALRWLAEETEFTFAAENLNGAADPIESMQAQLAESQRRERAAVEDIARRQPLRQWAIGTVMPNTGHFGVAVPLHLNE